MTALGSALRMPRLLMESVRRPRVGYDVRPVATAETETDFRRFVAARWGALQRYAFILTGDHQIAEDVVQAALEKCWRRWDKIQGDSPEGYVRTAVANGAASRRRRRTLPETSLDTIVVQPKASGDHAEIHALRAGLWAALNDLPPRQRTIVVLRLWEDRSVEETARVLGISSGAVKSQLSKGIARLREHPQIRDLPETLDRPEVSR